MPPTKPLVSIRIRKTPDPAPPPRKYRPKVTARHHTNVGVCQFWSNLFELNERLPKNGKMTDEEIKRQVLSEFPDNATVKRLLLPIDNPKRMTVNRMRCQYNLGRLNRRTPEGKVIIPEIQSYRYNLEGDRVNPRTGRPWKNIKQARKPTGAKVLSNKRKQQKRVKALRGPNNQAWEAKAE